MPQGKAPSSGEVYIKPTVTYAINTRLLRKHKKNDCPNLTVSQIREYRNIIANEISCYIGASMGVSYPTETQIRQELLLCIRSAKNLLYAISSQNYKSIYSWKVKLSRHLYNLHLDSRKRLYYLFEDPYKDSIHLKKSLDDYVPVKGFDQRFLKSLKMITNADSTKLGYLKGTPKLSNKPLNKLVRNLTPLWVNTTGKSVRRSSDKYEFAEWVIELLRTQNIKTPSKDSIETVCKGQS